MQLACSGECGFRERRRRDALVCLIRIFVIVAVHLVVSVECGIILVEVLLLSVPKLFTPRIYCYCRRALNFERNVAFYAWILQDLKLVWICAGRLAKLMAYAGTSIHSKLMWRKTMNEYLQAKAFIKYILNRHILFNEYAKHT